MFDYINYTLTYILIVGIILFFVVMTVVYKRTHSQGAKTAVVLFSITGFICGGYGAIICKSKTDQRLQEIEESRQLFETYSGPTSIQYKNYPPIYIDAEADIKNISVNNLKEYLDKTPEWLYKNANSITLTTQSSNIFPSLDKNSVGCSSYRYRTIYLTPYASFGTLVHEFGHIYDSTFLITISQNFQYVDPPEVLKANQKTVCEAASASPSDGSDFDHCMSTYQETFADAIALYVESQDKLPPDLKVWMDSLPK